MLLGLPETGDIDIATSATPRQIAELFDNVIPVGEHFGVMLVIAYTRNILKMFVQSYKEKRTQFMTSAMIALVVTAFFHFPFHIGRLAGLCVFLIALYHLTLEET